MEAAGQGARRRDRDHVPPPNWKKELLVDVPAARRAGRLPPPPRFGSWLLPAGAAPLWRRHENSSIDSYEPWPSSSNSCVTAFFNDIDPELKCDVLSIGPSQIGAHFVVVPISQDRQIERNRLGEVCEVITIALEIAFEFR